MLKNPIDIIKCTRCDNLLDNIRIELTLTTEVSKNIISGTSLSSREILCPNCFYELINNFEYLSEENQN